MEHPIQEPFDRGTFQNLAGVRRIRRIIYNYATGERINKQFYEFPPIIQNATVVS
jgi:hypothetical protein